MGSRLHRLILQALRAATPSVEIFAERLELSTSALRRYRLANRRPSLEIVKTLIRELRGQARSLERIADQLEEVLNQEEEHHA